MWNMWTVEYVDFGICGLWNMWTVECGCITCAMLINHLMYADDLVIMCPYSRGLARLLKICSKYGSENYIRYNSTKLLL